ncbi:hypothetical protein KSP39_PZI016591 [Platanthera zijinensis]|uniref:Uncharacterized protein n=1 Tax=Platanthera zijinensis TaxID=2320716 RepID=A0AAP0B7M7_9ASPA
MIPPSAKESPSFIRDSPRVASLTDAFDNHCNLAGHRRISHLQSSPTLPAWWNPIFLLANSHSSRKPRASRVACCLFLAVTNLGHLRLFLCLRALEQHFASNSVELLRQFCRPFPAASSSALHRASPAISSAIPCCYLVGDPFRFYGYFVCDLCAFLLLLSASVCILPVCVLRRHFPRATSSCLCLQL